MKLILISISGEAEKLQATAALTGGAASFDAEVNVFVTMDALASYRKDIVERKAWKAGGEVGESLLKMDKTFIDYLQDAKDLGNVKVYGCQDSLNLLGLTKDDLVDIFDDIVSVTDFYKFADGAQILTL